MRPSRMAAEENLSRPAAVLGDVLVRPGESAGYIFDMFGMLDAGREPVVRDHCADAVPRELLAERAVDAEKVFVPRHPGAAVDEEQHREVLLALRQVKIEFVLGLVGVLTVVIRHIANGLDLKRLRGTWLFRSNRRARSD